MIASACLTLAAVYLKPPILIFFDSLVKSFRQCFRCLALAFVVAGFVWAVVSGDRGMVAAAEATATSDPAFVIKSWRTIDGLPQNSVLALAQTPDGYLWVGTRGGLARFDGVRFRNYGLADGLKGLSIWSLAEDGQGGLWIGTLGGGLSHWQDGKITTWTTADGLAHNDVMALAAAGPGAVWVGTKRGLQHFGPDGFTQVGDVENLRREVVALAADRDGGLWVTGEWSGLYFCKGGHCELIPGPPELPEVHSYSLVVDTEGNLWVSPGNGFVLRRQPTGAWTAFTQKDGVPYEFIRSLAQGASGEIWGASPNAGLYVFREGRFHAVVGMNPAARSVLMSREGILWAGMPTSGLCRLTPKRLAAYLVGQEDHPVTVTSLVEATPGEFLVATYGNGLFRGSLDRLESVQIEKTLVDRPHLTSVLKMRDGVVWVGGAGVLARREPGAGEFQTVSLAHNLVALCEGADGTLWMGSREGELLHLVDDKPQPVAQGSMGALVSALISGDGSSLWVATQGAGLVRWENGQVERWTTKEGLPTDVVRALHRDAAGTLWIGTGGGGIAWLEAGRIRAVNSQSGLADDFISQILEDDDGNLWLGGNHGISRVSKRELRAVASGQAATVHPLVVDETDGMLAAECTGGTSPAGWRSASGKLHFSTMRGIAVVDPAQFGLLPSPPAVRIEEVKLDGKTISVSGGVLSLPPGSRELQISYTAFNYAKPEQIRFRHRLVGGDEQWVEGMATRSVRFFQLKPGDYTFQVTAANQDGRWHATGASLAFTVLPFYWQTGWFRVVVALILIGCVGGAVWRLVRARLQRSEFRKAVLDSVAAKIVVLNHHGVIVAVNARWRQFALENPARSGDPARNFGVGSNYIEVCRQIFGGSAESAKAAYDGIQAVLAGRMKNFSLEYACDSPQPPRWLSISVTPLGQTHRSVVVSHFDITDRKQLEEASRNEQRLMAALFNSIPGLLYLYTEDGRLVQWNKQHEKLTGFTSEELLNRHARDWYDDEDLNTFDRAIRKIFSEGYADAEMKLIHKNGERVPYFLTGSKVIIDGKPHLVGIAIDISVRKKAEAELRQSEERFRAVVEQASDGFELLDLDGRYLEVNAATLRQLDYSREEMLRLTVFDVVPSLDRDRFNQDIQAISGAKPLLLETLHRRKDGITFPVEVTISTIQIGERRCLFALVRDITDRKQAEAELLRQRAELAHVARVSTMGELAASVAHELNQPLGAILANAEAADLFLNQNPPALGELRDILTDIRKDDERASEVIRRMRALLRKHEMDRQPLEINSLVEDVLQVISGDAALRKMAISAELAPGLPKILGDRIHLQQVMLNLLLNGMDAMAGEPRERRRLSIRTRLSADGLVEISVLDSGHGIAPDKLSHVFEPFYTTKPNGMGMGLSISRTIIAAHHGKISAENNAAGGATFRVTLPTSGKGQGASEM